MHSGGSHFLLLWVNWIGLCSSSLPLSLPLLISFLTATSTFTLFHMKSLVLFPKKKPYSSPAEGRYEWNILKSVWIHKLFLCSVCSCRNTLHGVNVNLCRISCCNLLQCNNIGGLCTTMSSSECWYSRALGTFWCKAASSGWSVVIKWRRQWC